MADMAIALGGSVPDTWLPEPPDPTERVYGSFTSRELLELVEVDQDNDALMCLLDRMFDAPAMSPNVSMTLVDGTVCAEYKDRWAFPSEPGARSGVWHDSGTARTALAGLARQWVECRGGRMPEPPTNARLIARYGKEA
jgi:hypothetical protein